MRSNMLTALLALALPLSAPASAQDARFPSEQLSRDGKTVTMNPKDHWTHTGVRVNEGDVIHLQVSGEVTVAPKLKAAGPGGIADARLGNAPFPNRAAGALIAKIGDDGRPIYIGEGEHTFKADHGGVLWLGVNDDYFDDNSGRFSVRIREGQAAQIGTSGRAAGDMKEATVTMDPKDHWTRTGVTVQEGDMIRIEASGTVDVAPTMRGGGPAGVTKARVGNAPFPNRPAGALIAKIGEDGEPIFIGAEQHTFRANRSGQLWLGVNDDYFDDNTGQFRVRVSTGDAREMATSGSTADTAQPRGTSGAVTERTITVQATDQWTDTGIMLRAGDILRLESSGTISLTEGERDQADAAGSRTRTAPNAPFANRPAGALIARIGDGEPIFVGARQRNIRVTEDGTLWLGVNDDHHADNGGAFEVQVAVRPGRR